MTGKKKPLVTVIMPAYNDAAHIKKAIDSVLNQTLHNLEIIVVDDHSTDNTIDVIESIMRRDSRLRYEVLPKNTGAAGTPRNKGIEISEGQYIFFLDSDDTLDRHALKNLYQRAVEDGCDFVIGKTVRYHLVSKRRQSWLGYLMGEDIHNTSITERGEFVDDTLITNKLYKRSFLVDNDLYFEEGIHYEDVIYAARIFSRAESFSVITDEVYIWNVYDSAVKKSITNQRDSVRSLRDRLYANKQRAQIYASLGNSTIDRLCQVHFLKHSAILYLMDASEHTDAYLDSIIELLYPEVVDIPEDSFNEITMQNRVMYGMLLLKDKVGLRELSYYRKYGEKFAAKIIRKGKKAFWVSSTTSTVPRNTRVRDLLDITPYRLIETPVSKLTYYHELTAVERVNGGIELKGVSRDPLSKFTVDDTLRMAISIEKRGKRELSYQFGARVTQNDKGEILWKIRIPNFQFSMHDGYEAWSVLLDIEQGSRRNKSPIHVGLHRNLRNGVIYSRSPVRSLIGCGLTAYRAVNGDLAFRHTEYKKMSKAMGLYKRAIAYRLRLLALMQKISRASMVRVWYPIFCTLPLNKKTVLFESQLGQMATGSPSAVYEQMRADNRFASFKFVWSSRQKSPEHDNDEHTKYIERGSIRYFWHLATAGILVDDQTFPKYFTKRVDQVYIQTWHGIPLKRMGLDQPSVAQNKERSDDTVRRAKMWNALIAPCQYFIDTFAHAFRYEGEFIKWGTPRNDRLYSATKKLQQQIRQKLDLPKDRKIILYAPTFRDDSRGKAFTVPMNLYEWRKELGDDTYLLIRTHYLNRVGIPKQLAAFCMNVSDYPDLDELYIASDMMITDYSSTMFDYATLGRPMIFYTYDYEEYMHSDRGAYFELNEHAPGPVVKTQDELFSGVKRAIKQPEPDDRYKRFVDEYCGVEDGKASSRVVDFIAQEVRKG